MDSIEYEAFKDHVSPGDKILMMFSGGIDSVAVLYMLLRDTKCPIHVHHIVFKNGEQRWRAEQIAVKKTLKYLTENFREVEYSESTYGFGTGTWCSFDAHFIGFIAAQVIMSQRSKIRYIATGRCADDLVRRNSGVNAGDGNVLENVFDAAVSPMPIPHRPILVRPLTESYKSETINLIPPELLQITWSCRRPKKTATGFERCGKCITCREMKQQNVWDTIPNTI